MAQNEEVERQDCELQLSLSKSCLIVTHAKAEEEATRQDSGSRINHSQTGRAAELFHALTRHLSCQQATKRIANDASRIMKQETQTRLLLHRPLALIISETKY